MKRYIYIIIGIVVVAIVAIVVILILKNRSTSTIQTPGTNGTLPVTGTTGGNQPTPTTGGTNGNLGTGDTGTGAQPSSTQGESASPVAVKSFGPLSNAPVLDYYIDGQNRVTAVGADGSIMGIMNGQSSTIDSTVTNGIISASFSYDGTKILVSSGDPANPQASMFDMTKKIWTPLPQGLISPQWSPNSYQLAYLSVPSKGMIALSTIDATNPKKAPAILLSLHANDLTLQWINKSQFVLSDRPTSQAAGSILLFDSAKGTLTPIVYGQNGAESIWTHNTAPTYALASFADPSGQGEALQLITSTGTVYQQLNFSTLPSKCAFNNETTTVATTTATITSATTTAKTKTVAKPTITSYLALYCAIPRSSSGFAAATLPDDYTMMSLFTSDDIYKMNTNASSAVLQSVWADQTQNIDVSNMKMFNGALFFINRFNQKLYGLIFAQ